MLFVCWDQCCQCFDLTSVTDAGETLDKDRFVAFMELLEWKSKDEIKEELQADFQYFDKDNSGALDQTELTAILTQYGVEGLPEEEVKELIATFDKDGDEKISIEGNSFTCFFYLSISFIMFSCRY